MACLYCRLEMCFMCDEPTGEDPECCCGGTYGLPDFIGRPKSKRTPIIGRPVIEDGLDMKNAKDTGRARALDVAPIPEGYICEWANLLYAGGGVVPIIGCIAGLAEHRHHGPDKGTLVNTVGVNLHRICTDCHNRWHVLNDPFYPSERPKAEREYYPTQKYVEHDRKTPATFKDQRTNEVWWNTPIDRRGKYGEWIEKVEDGPTT